LKLGKKKLKRSWFPLRFEEVKPSEISVDSNLKFKKYCSLFLLTSSLSSKIFWREREPRENTFGIRKI
jgi:hypothetical protein